MSCPCASRMSAIKPVPTPMGKYPRVVTSEWSGKVPPSMDPLGFLISKRTGQRGDYGIITISPAGYSAGIHLGVIDRHAPITRIWMRADGTIMTDYFPGIATVVLKDEIKSIIERGKMKAGGAGHIVYGTVVGGRLVPDQEISFNLMMPGF